MRIYNPQYSIETAGWSIEPSEDCLTLQPGDVEAALQISCYTKRNGEVTEKDLLLPWKSTFANVSCDKINVNCGLYSGICAEFVREGVFWRVWSLRKNNANLFITYNCDPENREHHRDVIDWMMNGIKEGRA